MNRFKRLDRVLEALYNKYRPRIFEDVVGQEHIERTLKNAIAANKISHAYMFTGPRGTGKTTTARLLSKSLLCEKAPTPDPDGTCEDCELIATGDHPDVYELDAASRTGVENVREEIIGKVDYAPTRGKCKVYIIDEVHMLSTAAFNALLKTLEEPPDHVVFIMCTTDPQRVPETILSRCQRFDFRRISPEEMVSRLGAICEMEGIEFEGDALDLIAHRAQGGMRDALTSLEQLIAFGNGEVSVEVAERLLGTTDSSDLADMVKAIGTRDAAECFNWTASYMETGADLVQFVDELTQHMRDMYVMSLAGNDVALDVTEAGRKELEGELGWFGSDRLARMLDVLGDLIKELKTSTNQRLTFEIALTRMIRPESDITLSSLAERIEGIERALERGSVAAPLAFAGEAISSDPSIVGSPGESTPCDAGRKGAPSSKGASIEGDASTKNAGTPSIGEASSAPNEPMREAQAQQVSSQTSPHAYQDVSQAWGGVLAHLKKIGPAFGVIFMNTAVSMEGDELIIAFSKNNDFSFKAAQKQDAKEALEQALAKAGLAGIAYKIVQNDGVVGAPAPASMGEGVQNRPDNSGLEGSRDATQAKNPAPESPGANAQSRQSASENAASGVQVAESGSQNRADAEGADGGSASSANTGEYVPPWEDEPVMGNKAGAATATDAAPTDITDDSGNTVDAVESAENTDTGDSDFQDFLTSAFGEGIVFEEIEE